MFIGNKKCRIYAACGVSQTPKIYQIREGFFRLRQAGLYMKMMRGMLSRFQVPLLTKTSYLHVQRCFINRNILKNIGLVMKQKKYILAHITEV